MIEMHEFPGEIADVLAKIRPSQAAEHGREDARMELRLSKKHNDLIGGVNRGKTWKVEDSDSHGPAHVIWEALYPEMRREHAFTGLLQRFQAPMGNSNHVVRCIWTSEV